jgi:hypothetical protein
VSAVDINFSAKELNWLNNYAGNHDLTVHATVRQAVRLFSLIEATPGALEWLTKQTREQLGSKDEPMPALETKALHHMKPSEEAVFSKVLKTHAIDSGTLLCDDCPPASYPTDKTRCTECPRRSQNR